MESNTPTTFDIKYAGVRQAVIEQRFERLNDKQREAVYTTDGPLLILAGAGSGKTTVLINRIINLIRFGKGREYPFAPEGVDENDLLFLTDYLLEPKPENRARAEELCAVSPAKPWEIIAITFTNKAANELRERLYLALGDPEAASGVWAYTFHAACLRILRRNADLLGYGSAMTIYDEDEKKSTISAILKNMGISDHAFDPRSVMREISRAKDKLLTPKKFRAETGGDYFLEKVADIYEQYEREMHKACALDFDDIIMKTVQLLKANPDVLDYYQHKFRYVLVDEYQDTNYAQYVLTSLLAGYYKNICVVGDDDQSIYKFRGATLRNILEFEKQFDDAKTIRLEQNYRSTGVILNAANEVIRNNRKRKGKELWTAKEGGERIRLHRAENQTAEAEYIAETIMDGVQKGRKYGDYAVLYRNNVLSDNILQAFIRNHVPYRIYKGRDFFGRAEVRDMFAYLWVLENPADELRLRRIINVPSRKIGDKSVERAAEIAAENGVTLYEVVRTASSFSELSRSAKAMEGFIKLMDGLRGHLGSAPLSVIYDELIDQTGYIKALEKKGGAEEQNRIEHVQELKSHILKYEKDNSEPTLGGFLEEMALYTDADQAGDTEDAVLMMTIHSAKGLEFPAVFIAGMEDGLFPGYRTIGLDEEMEEERRLCYVAMTRAKEQLYLTCAGSRLIYGRTQYPSPSRFIEEMPSELINSNIGKKRPSAVEAGAQARPDSEQNVKNRAKMATKAAAKSRTPSSLSSSGPLPDFPVGCRVTHNAFGEGMVVSVKPMGYDALLEIAFDSVGTKRLMARQAANFMKRLH